MACVTATISRFDLRESVTGGLRQPDEEQARPEMIRLERTNQSGQVAQIQELADLLWIDALVEEAQRVESVVPRIAAPPLDSTERR